MFRSNRPRGPGFTLIEILVVIATVTLITATLLPALGESRRAARLTGCLANLQQFAVATGTYAADYSDLIWAFSWRATGTPNNPRLPSPWPQYQFASNDVVAGKMQALDILSRRTGRDPSDFFPIVMLSWIPHVYYMHLVIQDYLGARLPEKMVACPEDRYRLDWQIDPANNFDQNVWFPLQEDARNPVNRRWPYSASYQTPAANYDRGQSDNRISQAEGHMYYWVPGWCELGGRRLTNVEHPSQKIMLHDGEQRHFTRNRVFFGWTGSRQPLLYFDGSVRVEVTGLDVYHHPRLNRLMRGNEGWTPTAPHSPSPTYIDYVPRRWEAPAQGPFGVDTVPGYYRWTREGLAGIDFGGMEVYPY